jgi:RNA polymerase sigma factor (sigma-70 family)
MSPRFSIRPMSSLGDRRLAELAAGGEERAFEVLLRRHRGELERYCRRLGLPEHRAEDVLQQSFTRAWVALRGGSNVGQPRAWLFRIVHNAAQNAHRSARLRMHEPIESAEPAAATVDLESSMRARAALRQVAELPPMQRDAVVMTAIEGRSHEETAGALGVSHGAVRALVHRARTRMRAAAAALAPQGLAGLLGRGAADGAVCGPGVEAGGAAGAGIAGLLAKGAAFTAVTGLLAGGAAVQLDHHRHAARSRGHAEATEVARGPAAASPSPQPLVAPGATGGALKVRHGHAVRHSGRGRGPARRDERRHRAAEEMRFGQERHEGRGGETDVDFSGGGGFRGERELSRGDGATRHRRSDRGERHDRFAAGTEGTGRSSSGSGDGNEPEPLSVTSESGHDATSGGEHRGSEEQPAEVEAETAVQLQRDGDSSGRGGSDQAVRKPG